MEVSPTQAIIERQNMDVDSNSQSVRIRDLPEEILEYVLRYLSPYRDLKSAMLVCHQWHRLVQGVLHQIYMDFLHSLWDSKISWTEILPEVGSNITERYSHCACYYDKSAYIFGGCTSTNTTFNDLWRFDLSTRQWVRPLAIGTYPSPKACSSMTVYKDSLVLFGGWSHPTPYPLHQAARFFSELHMYKPETNRWYHITTMSPTSPKPTAGHSASVVGDTMVVFGGSHIPGAGTNEVWVFDFNEMLWKKKQIGNKKPSPRYGQTQMTIDDSHILIIGGCGGPNQIFSDVWLLSLDSEPWQWQEVRVLHPENAAPQLWCHPACKVGDMIVVLSKPSKPLQSSSSKDNSRENQATMRPTFSGNRVWVPPRGDNSQDSPSENRNRAHPMLVSDSDDSSGAESEDNMPGQGGQRPEFKHPSYLQLRSSRSRGHMNQSPRGRGGHLSPNRLQGQGPFAAGMIGDAPELPSEEGACGGTSSLRPGVPSVRPNAMKNRQRQLEALRKFEEKLRESRIVQSTSSGRGQGNVVGGGTTGSCRENRVTMHLHVLDISEVIKTNTATWRPINENISLNAPEETIFYSLVEGRGELIVFGGIQRDIQSMQRGMDVKPQVVSNSLYIVSPRKQYL
ncbi:F-box only protein 42-like [Ylistrum balloti]|uniref:F-box only protein 42-like n=1 Tax=Ylistrum balloti TaxID=509963 RepID=UPI0029059C1C|nr:F-box only protein 42-like [Ylistrum balloti]